MTTINELIRHRQALQDASSAIDGALADIRQAGKEGADAAGYAVCWAAVMLATGILKTGLSAGNKSAAAGFLAVDKAIDTANKLISAFTGRKTTKKSDLMKSVDPNLAVASGLLRDVTDARHILGKAGAKPPPHLALILDLAIQMSEDTILMLQAAQTQQQVRRHNDAAQRQVIARLQSIRVKMSRLDNQLEMAFAQIAKMENVA